MGFFNKTEEELRLEEEQKKIRLLTTEIRNAYGLEDRTKNFLIEYIDKVRKGYPNDFHDLDTLIQVTLKLIESHFYSHDEFLEHFQSLVEVFHQVANKERADYERNKELFLSDFIGEEGIIYHGLFDNGMYAMWQDKADFFDIMSVINHHPTLRENFETIKTYIQSVSKYCLNQDVLKRDIISYLKGFENVLDGNYEKYSEQQLEGAKRRIGVYNLSPKELASCDSKLQRVEGYLDQFGIYMTNLTEERQAVSALVESGKKEIKQETKNSIEQLKRLIEVQKQGLMEKLDQYLLDLEETLKDKSDETFRQIIETYKDQVAEFRNIFKGYSMGASKDLIAIQQATQESIRTLQNYVTNEPQLQELLTRAQEQNSVREKIVELVSKEEELIAATQAQQAVEEKRAKERAAKEKEQAQAQTAKSQIIIPGYDRVMVPYRRMILPETVPTSILPALDESIPFEKRLEELERKMKIREGNGEIFHKKVKDIAIDIMEGDWPYLWGPSGTGKSFMAKQVASLLGMKFMKAGKITEPHSILGYNDPQGRYQITPTFMSVLYGYLLSLDEMDNGNPDTQVVLNDIYSELLNKMEDPSEICEVMFGTDVPVDVNPNFRMISAGNTSGEGENSVFSSRGKMDESIQERMTPIYIDYDDRVEEKILSSYPAWYKFFIDFRHACMDFAENNGLESAQGITTTRDAAAIKKYIEHNSKSIDQIIAEKFVQIKDSEYRKALGKAIASMYGIDYSDCKNPNFKGQLRKADEKVLAKKFIYYCKNGVK